MKKQKTEKEKCKYYPQCVEYKICYNSPIVLIKTLFSEPIQRWQLPLKGTRCQHHVSQDHSVYSPDVVSNHFRFVSGDPRTCIATLDLAAGRLSRGIVRQMITWIVSSEETNRFDPGRLLREDDPASQPRREVPLVSWVSCQWRFAGGRDCWPGWAYGCGLCGSESTGSPCGNIGGCWS